MKRLLVTSDDFGMCSAVNLGIVRAMTEGIVRSTNLMVPCPAFEDAVRLARKHDLPVGVHLTLTNEWDRVRWGPLTSGPGLRDRDGFFPHSHDDVERNATDAEIEAEFVAQIEAVINDGLRVTHLDTHMLASRSPGAHPARIQAIVRRLASRLGVPYTYESHDGRLRHFEDDVVLSGLDADTRAAVLDGFEAPGLYHLITHAGVPDAGLDELCSERWPGRAWAETYRTRDLAYLLAPETRADLRARGFELVGIDALDLSFAPVPVHA